MPKLPKSTKKKWIASSRVNSYSSIKKESDHSKFYRSSVWIELRNYFIKKHPLCSWCEEEGITNVADVVDHIIEIKDNGDRLDETNLQSLCHKHHNQKTIWERTKRNRKKRDQ